MVNRLHHELGIQFIYDRETLVDSLRKSGFEKNYSVHPDQVHPAALPNVDRHAAEIGEEFNELESLILEAVK